MRLFDREHFALVYMSVFPYELNIASKKYNCSPVDGSSLCMITISYICKCFTVSKTFKYAWFILFSVQNHEVGRVGADSPF